MSRIWNRFREQIKKDREKPGMLLADGDSMCCGAGAGLSGRKVRKHGGAFLLLCFAGRELPVSSENDPEKPGYGSRREQLPDLLCGGRLL